MCTPKRYCWWKTTRAARLAQEVLKQTGFDLKVRVVEDGEQAMAYLKKEGPFTDNRRPELILLDLNLPRKDGREVVAEMKLDAELSSIPVVVLTSSSPWMTSKNPTS